MPFEMFGQSLSSNMQNVVKQPIPYFLETTMAYILINGGFDSSDLFSRKEDENKIRLLRRQVDNGELLGFNDIENVDNASNLILSYFNSLPISVIPFPFWDVILESFAQNDQSLRFRIFKKILFVLPEGNFSTLRLLLKFLSEYIEHNPNKKTYRKKAADAFYWSIIRSSNSLNEYKKVNKTSIEIIEYLIEHFEYFFDIRESWELRSYESSFKIQQQPPKKIPPSRDICSLILEYFSTLTNLREVVKSNQLKFSMPRHIFEIFVKNDLVEMISKVVESEALKIKDYQNSIHFLQNPLLSDLLRFYFETIGATFYVERFSKPIRRIIRSVNKRKKRSHAKVLAKIERTVVRIFGTIQDTIQYLPSEIISLVLMINKSVHTTEKRTKHLNVVCSLGQLFFNFYCPCLLEPTKFKIQIQDESESSKNFLKLLSSVLQKIAIQELFPKDDSMEPLNNLIQSQFNEMKSILNNLMGQKGVPTNFTNDLLSKWNATSNPTEELYKKLYNNLDIMFASSIDPKVRSPTEYDIDFKTVKQVESLLNSWPKIPQSPKEKDKEKDDKDREKDLFFPLKLSKATANEVTKGSSTTPTGKKCCLGIVSKFVVLYHPDKTHVVTRWAISNIKSSGFQNKYCYLVFSRGTIYFWFQDLKETKRFLQQISTLTGIPLEGDGDATQSLKIKSFSLGTRTRRASWSEKSWWIQRQEVKRSETMHSFENLMIEGNDGNSEMISTLGLSLISANHRFLEALNDVTKNVYELTFRFKRKFSNEQIPDIHETQLDLQHKFSAGEPNIPEIIDLVRATKFVIELSVWILNCYQKLPQTLEADLIKSLQEKATVVNDSLKTLTQHINQLQTTTKPTPEERRAKSLDSSPTKKSSKSDSKEKLKKVNSMSSSDESLGSVDFNSLKVSPTEASSSLISTNLLLLPEKPKAQKRPKGRKTRSFDLPTVVEQPETVQPTTTKELLIAFNESNALQKYSSCPNLLDDDE